MTRVARFLGAVLIAASAVVGTTAPTLAECMKQVNLFPDFTDVAPTADTVVIGTVVATGGDDGEPSPLIALRADVVLRGHAPGQIELEGLRTGLRLRGSQACRENASLYAQEGDVIALALDGRLGGRDSINTAAWIEGRPDLGVVRGAEVLSREEAVAAAKALPPTDAASTQPLFSVTWAVADAAAGALAGVNRSILVPRGAEESMVFPHGSRIGACRG